MFGKYIRNSKSLSTFYKYNFSAYDVVIVGGGPGGYVAAIKAAQLGLKTACIEKRGTLGGTCLNVGCIPSKALLNISHKYEEAEHNFKSMGINVDNLSFDWATVQKKKGQSVNALCSGIEGLFKKNKVEYLKGHGSIVSGNSLSVAMTDGTNKTVEAKNIILATGSEPTPFPGIAFDEENIVSSTGALSLKNVPKSMIVIGGGVIGLEMGSVYKRFGTEVHVIEYMDRITPGLDKEVSVEFMKILKKQGIKFNMSTKVVSGKNVSGGVEIVVEDAKGGNSKTLSAEKVLISTGRRSVTEGLGLEKVGLATDKTGKIEVNEHFETKTSSIFAIGDIVSGPMLAHKAEEEGIACVEYIASKIANHSFGGHVNYGAIPNVVYTNPEVAAVGKTEEELKAEGVNYRKGKFPFLANSRAKTNDDFPGFVKVLADAQTDRILGVHIIGPNAGELIAEAVLAMEYGASSEDIARTCHAHPTLSEAMKEACLATFDKPIHM